MSDADKPLNWGQIVSNAVSTLVAAVFIGAAIIVWNAATTMDEKIKPASDRLESSQIELKGTQKVLLNEVSDLQAKIAVLENRLAKMTQKVTAKPKSAAKVKPSKTTTEPKTANNFSEKIRKDNLDRLQRDLQIYQMAK